MRYRGSVGEVLANGNTGLWGDAGAERMRSADCTGHVVPGARPCALGTLSYLVSSTSYFRLSYPNRLLDLFALLRIEPGHELGVLDLEAGQNGRRDFWSSVSSVGSSRFSPSTTLQSSSTALLLAAAPLACLVLV